MLPACLISLSCILGFLAGCSGPHKTAGDPLFGEFGPKGTGPGYVPGGVNKTQADGVPPIPSANSAVSMAALASGELPGSRTLAIGMPADRNPPLGWQNGQGALTSAPKDQAPATLSRPEPLVQPIPRAAEPAPVTPVSNPAPAPAVNPSAGASSVQADANLLAQLASRGVTYQRADNVAGGVQFSCRVPAPQNPNVSRVYTAIGPTADAAVRAVLWKIDQKK